jgi:1-deoxy-D-xylulose-5-phosphate synthase
VGPNLGVVELTIALHRVFETPGDSLVFDVAHQGYVHKLLTGRGGDVLPRLRHTGGASGFLYRPESEHDSFGAGHAGTALSAALGMATARDLKGTGEHVVAVCGDAAFTCGITLEALNNVVSSTKRLVVVLNDNQWSIAKNVGAMAKYLNRLSTSTTYNRVHHDLEKFFMGLPHGHEMNQLWVKWKRETKDFFVNSSLFEKFGLRYIGPIDGHNLDELQKNLEFAKQCDVPVLLHVMTMKGKGLDAAINSPEKFHGVGAFDPVTGDSVKPKAGTPRPTRTSSGAPSRASPGPTPGSSGSRARCRAARASPSSRRSCRGSSSTSASPRSTPSSSPPAWRPRGCARCAPSIPPSCSAPTTRSSTTSRSRTCPSPSAWTGRASRPTTARRTTGSSTSPTFAACRT